jgi:hypothetical protein
MAVSLYQSALTAEANGQFKKAGVIKTFVETSPLLAAFPMLPIQGNSFAWTRQASLGSAGTRVINGSYTESVGTVETRSVALKIIGGDMDVDQFLLQTHGPEHRAIQEQAKAALIAQTISWQIIKGSVLSVAGATGDANGIDGLQVRYGGGFGSTAVVDAGENAAQIIQNNTGGSGDALSLRQLDTLIQAVENPTGLLMAKKMRVNLTAKLRNANSISTGRDEFGRIVTSYQGLPIIDADVLGTVSGLEQLGFNENNNSTTSVYCMSLSDMGLAMVTNGGVQVRDLGEQNAKAVQRTRVEMYFNIADMHPRCVARLYNISDAVAVD